MRRKKSGTPLDKQTQQRLRALIKAEGIIEVGRLAGLTRETLHKAADGGRVMYPTTLAIRAALGDITVAEPAS